MTNLEVSETRGVSEHVKNALGVLNEMWGAARALASDHALGL